MSAASRDGSSAVASPVEIWLWLGLMFGEATADLGLAFNIWTLQDRASRFFRGDDAIDNAVDYCVDRCARGMDVYAGMGTFEKTPTDGGRGLASDVSAISALWADVDVMDPTAHKGKRYPDTIDDALRVVGKIGVAPSFRVHSGYGLHAYWRLQEPWDLRDQKREDVELFMARWKGTVKSAAADLGYFVDSTFDVARVLRVPGTMNFKVPSEPKPVRLVGIARGEHPRSYLIDDLEVLLIAPEYVQDGPGTLADVSHFVLNPDGHIDADGLSAARANDRQFDRTWEGKRDDLADQSPSAYDMALANKMVAFGWDDQTIVDALVFWRRVRKHPQKLRRDYYQRTVGKARASIESQAALAKLTSPNSDVPVGVRPEDMTEKDRTEVLNWLRNFLGIRLAAWLKMGEDDAQYFVRLDDGEEFNVGNAASVLRQDHFRVRIFERCGVVLQYCTRDEWRSVVQRLQSIVEYRGHEESRSENVTEDMVRQYLERSTVLKAEEWTDALRENLPFTHPDGTVNVHLGHFRMWVRQATGERLIDARLRSDFKLIGLESVRREGWVRGRRHNRHYWAVPAGRIMGDGEAAGQPVGAAGPRGVVDGGP